MPQASTTTNSRNLEQRYLDLIRTFITIVEQRNPYNIDHCRLVARLCEQMARKVSFDKQSRNLTVRAAELHTLGVSLSMEEKKPQFSLPITNLGISSGRELPSHQREKQILTEIMGDVAGLKECIAVICDRNEWYDGSASPFGKKGNEIAKEARLLAVADAFIDLRTPKKHRQKLSSRQAIEQILECSGTQFDPLFVEALQTALLESEDEALKETGRSEHFETSRCRHYLNLGHLYIAIHETEWALRSYHKAERIAVEIQDSGLELGAISGQVMAFCEHSQLEQAREALQRARNRTYSEREKHGYHLMWGLLEWMSGREQNGQDILDGLIAHYRSTRNILGLAASLIFQSYLLLCHRGLTNDEHLETLHELMAIVARYDLFDIVERYRKFTIPLFLSAVIHQIEASAAQVNLSKMGEPCLKQRIQEVSKLPPTRWLEYLTPEPIVPSAKQPLLDAGSIKANNTISQECVSIKLLGPISIAYAGIEIKEDEWPTQKALRIFAHLAITRTAISDELLMETLWPDAPTSKARNSLRNAIHQARTVLKKLIPSKTSELLQRSRKSGTTSLSFKFILDTERLEHLLQQAASALEADKTESALEQAKLALNLYRGDFMEGFHDYWVEGLRVSFRELQQRALAILSRAYLNTSRFEEAEVAARRMLSIDDLREDAHQIVIRALVADGRSAEAIRHYEQAVNLFEREIGVSPANLTAILQETGLLL